MKLSSRSYQSQSHSSPTRWNNRPHYRLLIRSIRSMSPRDEEASPNNNAASSSASPSSIPVSLQSIDANDMHPVGFTNRRLLCFIGIVGAYMGLYFTRGSLTYTAPILLADKSMAVSLTDIGLMTSAFPLAYGISKFLGGVLGAKFSSSLMLSGGLLLTALVNFAFGMSSNVQVWAALWFLNGSIQGIGAPASAALLTRWFASKERGTWWGFWNCGANLGGFLTPILVATIARDYGWRWGMWGPGIIAAFISIFALAAIKESPQEAGYERRSVQAAAKLNSITTLTQEAREKTAMATAATLKKDGGWAIRAALISTLQNPGIWLLALTYFFVYVLRQGATSWLVLLLIQEKGAADASQAAQLVSGLELGGLVGGTLAGMWSDLRIRFATPDQGSVGLRIQIVMTYIVGSVAVLYLLCMMPASAPNALKWLVISMLGFTIYGPQMLIGLCGAELVTKGAVGASQGFLGLIAYLGAANAGVPLSIILKTYGWPGYFWALSASCVCAFLLLLPLVNAKSFAQNDSRSKNSTA